MLGERRFRNFPLDSDRIDGRIHGMATIKQKRNKRSNDEYRRYHHIVAISVGVVRELAERVPEAASVDAAMRVVLGLEKKRQAHRSVITQYQQKGESQ